MYMEKSLPQVSSCSKWNKRTVNGILTLSLLLLYSLPSYSQKQKNEAFIIHSTSAHVKNIEIKARKSTNNTVTINLSSETAGSAFSETPEGNNSAKWANIPTPQITNITVMRGFYSTIQKINESNRSNSTLLSQVTYPLRLKVEISDQNFEVEILEPGTWTIKVYLDNIYNPDLFNTPVN
jgi:hypothetical protein